MSKKLINLSNLQKFLLKLNERFALKKAMKGITEDSEGNIIIGEEGLVPTPDENSKGKFLRSDGTWSVPGDSPLYDPMTQEEGIEGVSEVNKVLSAKTLKAVVEDEISTNENVVHTSGIETIEGTKRFTSDINRKNTALDITTTPTSEMFARFYFTDKNDKSAACIQYAQRPNGVDYIGLRVRDKNSTIWGVQLNTNKEFVPLGNNSYSLGSSSSKWANVYATTFNGNLKGNADTATSANDPNAVHKTGNESINGVKSFNNLMYIYDNMSNKNRQMDLFTTPANTLYSHYMFVDKNNEVTAYMQYGQQNSGTDFIGLFIHDKSRNLHGIQVTTNNELIPIANNTYSLGSSSLKWANVYATTFNGKLQGNADTATSSTKATQDSAGQQIDKTYIKELSVSGRTITYKRGDNTTGTITTQDTNTTYSKLSQFTNDTGFITSSGSCNYATTAGSANSVAWENVTGKPAYITATWRSGTSWYRVWSDGWIEQGGRVLIKTDSNKADKINFPKAFSTNQYTAIISDQAYPETTNQETSGDVAIWGATSYMTTGMFVMSSAGSGRVANWYACGY